MENGDLAQAHAQLPLMHNASFQAFGEHQALFPDTRTHLSGIAEPMGTYQFPCHDKPQEPLRRAPPRRKYLKKNTEANICNQLLSFVFHKSKSLSTLKRVLKYSSHEGKAVCKLYYAYVGLLKNLRRGYMSKKILLGLCTNTECESLMEIRRSPIYLEELLSINEFCRLTRILMNYCAENVCPLAVMTSRKLFKEAHIEHFERRRQVVRYFHQRPT